MKSYLKKAIAWIACLVMVLTISTGMVFADDIQADANTNDTTAGTSESAGESSSEDSIEIILADGTSINIGVSAIKSADYETVEKSNPWGFNNNGTTVYGKFYKFSDVLTNEGVGDISDIHGLKVRAKDGFVSGYSVEDIEKLYIYERSEVFNAKDDSIYLNEGMVFGFAINGSAGNKWAKNIDSVELTNNHVWFFKKGVCQHYCAICGEAEPSIAVGEEKIYDCQIKSVEPYKTTNEEPWSYTGKGKTTSFVGTFYKLTDILTNEGIEDASKAHKIITTASDGFTNEFEPSEFDSLYIYDMGDVIKNGVEAAGDAGTYGTAIKGTDSAGKKWARNITTVEIVTDHSASIKDGVVSTICSICGEKLTLQEMVSFANDGNTINLSEDYTLDEDTNIDVGDSDKTVYINTGDSTLKINGTLTATNGNLVITGGTVEGTLGDNVKADGGIYNYEVAEENCTVGKAPVYNVDTKLYEVKEVDSYDAQIDINALERAKQELNDQIKALIAQLEENVTRIYGSTRYATAFKNADMLKELNGGSKFDTVVVTTGESYPDALSGSYLASKNDAPLLLINSNSAASVRDYISENVNEGGKIIIIGGENSIQDSWLSSLSEYKIERIAGKSRYETNLKILEAVGYNGGDIIVATGTNYADSLSASSLDMPILLVNGTGSLTDEQAEFLTGKNANMYIAGGTGSVSKNMEAALANYGTVANRFAGNSRYETSRMMADAFFTDSKSAVLTIGDNFPDGLSAGPVAAKLGAPILLTNSGKYSESAAYVQSHNIKGGIVVGGPGAKLITDDTVKAVFSTDKITVYEDGRY